MKKRIFTVALVLSTALACFAAITDLTGKWKGDLIMADGSEVPLTYTFKVDGDRLTGTILTPQDLLTITDGKITSDKEFTFKVTVNGDVVPSTGKFYGDSVVMTANLAGDKLKSTLKRVVVK